MRWKHPTPFTSGASGEFTKERQQIGNVCAYIDTWVWPLPLDRLRAGKFSFFLMPSCNLQLGSDDHGNFSRDFFFWRFLLARVNTKGRSIHRCTGNYQIHGAPALNFWRMPCLSPIDTPLPYFEESRERKIEVISFADDVVNIKSTVNCREGCFIPTHYWSLIWAIEA